jgi:hypothetical protein
MLGCVCVACSAALTMILGHVAATEVRFVDLGCGFILWQAGSSSVTTVGVYCRLCALNHVTILGRLRVEGAVGVQR